LTDRSENLLEVALNRFLSIESTWWLGGWKEDIRIFGEALYETLHVEVFERTKKLICRLPYLPLALSEILSGSRYCQRGHGDYEQARSHSSNDTEDQRRRHL
jgi:hypothetical protein